MERKKLFLLDAYALIFRAYHAMKYSPRITSGGMNTSAAFGFVNTLEEVLRKEKPTHLAVCFDPGGKTFRHEMYPDYKAGREAMPEDIRQAIPYIKEIIRAYRIDMEIVPGYEADDVIGTIAVKASARGFDTYIMTSDKDLGQVVSEHVRIYRPGSRGQGAEIRGVEEICSLYGIREPRQVIDLLALMGDKADNIPGCPGVGEKTAAKLIQEYGSVEGLLASVSSLKGALRQRVESNAGNIRFSKQLATICTEVPLDFDENRMLVMPPDADAIRKVFGELEFRSLLSRVLGEQSHPAVAPSPKKPAVGSLFDEITTEADSAADGPTEGEQEVAFDIVDAAGLAAKVDAALGCQAIGLYAVMVGEEAMHAVLRGVAVATSADEAFFVEFTAGSLFVSDEATALGRLLGNAQTTVVGSDLKKTMIVLRRNGVALAAPYFDVSVAHYLLQPEISHSLPRLSEVYLRQPIDMPAVPAGGRSAKADPLRDAPVGEVAGYACRCACAALRLRGLLDAAVAEKQMTHLLNDVEFPLIAVLADMEMTGVRIDVPTLRAYSQVLTQRMEGIERECMELAGTTFNVSSPMQVGEVLFERLKLDEKAKKTGRGQYTTTEEVLEKLRNKHPVVGKILEFRKLKKLLSTYVNALPELINPETGKIHTTYNQTVTATGRLSSTNPNLQNIPVRNEEGREIRKAFIPDDGHVFFSADYSQIELRIVANISGDEAMTEAFLAGEDIHRATAAKIFHERTEDVSPDQRRKAKTANFGMIYGISAFGLSERLQIPRQEAKEIIDGYFRTFPGVRRFMDESIAHARETGYVTTLFGRRRLLPDIVSKNAVVRGFAERNAINAPIQGAAADIIKIAMVGIFRRFVAEGIRSKMIMQVHDELNFDVLPEELETVARIVKEEMEAAYKSRVPLVADCGHGSNWLEAH